jgi:hypothetical protein
MPLLCLAAPASSNDIQVIAEIFQLRPLIRIQYLRAPAVNPNIPDFFHQFDLVYQSTSIHVTVFSFSRQTFLDLAGGFSSTDSRRILLLSVACSAFLSPI